MVPHTLIISKLMFRKTTFFRGYFSDLLEQELLGGCSVWSFTVDAMTIWPHPDLLCYKIGPLVWGDIVRDPVFVFQVLSKLLEGVLPKVLRAEKTKMYPESRQPQSRWISAPFMVEGAQSSQLVIKCLVGLLSEEILARPAWSLLAVWAIQQWQ